MDKDIMEIIDSEVEYAKGLWEGLSTTVRPLKDADKPVEFWVLHIHRYVEKAVKGTYGTDKTPALEAIRKIAALAVRCMENNETPRRE